ncbi:SDR family oxidoreductase [Mycolicibacterium komossense]|uniref:SDR family oxidoreductase n=2 Tax=Mycolicibacterium komossense TaxID=1779 RepID=A0ABT3CFZ5_9MYCO|nr:SDR family oxidoreductase [Mycolicibacterium komossense]
MGRYWHPHSLDGHAVIVTGAARGIGRGTAQALLERGAAVLLVDREESVVDLAAEFVAAGFKAEHCVADLRDAASPQLIVTTAVDKLGAVTALVNNAIACNEPKPFTDITQEDFNLVYDVGPRATFFLMQAVHPILQAAGGGSIVNFGSGSGTVGEPMFGAYASAKEAIRGMSWVAALEWGKDNIRINVVCPFANSDGVLFWAENFTKDYERAVRHIPLRRVGDTHDDIGAMIAFLLSPDASYLTAQTIHIDGGSGSFR